MNTIQSVVNYIKNVIVHNKDKKYRAFKANYLFSYAIGLCFLTIIGCVLWIFKDIFILGTDKIALDIILRTLPCSCLSLLFLCKNRKDKAWIVALISIWITITCNVILDAFVHPADGLTGEGWVMYFIFFFTLSIIADNQFIIVGSEFLLATVIIFTSTQYGGFIEYNTNIIRPTSTGLILSVGLMVMTLSIRTAFMKLYDNEKILKDIAKQDMLTGLYNRHKLDDMVTEDGKFHRLSTVMIFDIDKFKEINDGYGHIAGDEAIRFAAHTLSKSCRRNDVIVRFGGDEFVMILDGIVDTDIIWGKIKENLLNDNKYNVTFSAGSVKGDKDKDMYSLIKKADKGAYFSKEHGRNRLMKYEDLEMIEGKINGNS